MAPAAIVRDRPSDTRRVHTLNLRGKTGTDRLQPGDSQTADFGVIDADPQAWCKIPGHKQAGMVLTITATPGARVDVNLRPGSGGHR